MANGGQTVSSEAATIIAAIGGMGGGALLREAVALLFGRKKTEAEARKINAEAEQALGEFVDDRIKLLIKTEAATSARLRSDLSKVWRYVEELRSTLIKSGIPVPPPPVFDHEPDAAE